MNPPDLPPWARDVIDNPRQGLPPSFGKLLRVLLAVFLVVLFSSASTYVVEPGTRGIRVTLGKVADHALPEGFGTKVPLITTIVPVSVRQRTQAATAPCFSSDLQQVAMELRVLYRVPPESVIQIYKAFAGDPFDSLIAPRVQEALKEVTASLTAEQIVKQRETVKQRALAAARIKVGKIMWIEDIVIRDISLSSELEHAIEAKMVAEQQAAQARFTQQQTQVEAQTAVISARGEAEAIRVRGEALRLNPAFLRLRVAERWDGHSPLAVPQASDGVLSDLLLPLGRSGRAGTP